MFKIILFLTIFFNFPVLAQRPDLDDLSRELDLSILEEEFFSRENEEIAANHLFESFEQLTLPEPENGIFQQEEGNPALYFIHLTADNYLVAPNPARIDTAYKKIAEAVQTEKLTLRAPLKVVLHADGNFSIAVGLQEPPSRQLPAGLDLSPLPSMVFAAVVADIQLLQKEHPTVLEAYLQLRRAAAHSGLELDTREFYFFPVSPGKVYFALRVKKQNPVGKPQNPE